MQKYTKLLRRPGSYAYAVLIAVALRSTAWANVIAVGEEFRVDTQAVEFQFGAVVSTAADGRFVVVWQTGGDVLARRYDSAGVALGNQFQVKTYVSESVQDPDVSVADDGSFVVVWQAFGHDGSGSGIFGRRYDGAGVALGTEFQINTYTTSFQRAPKVASAADGSYIVVWSSDDQDGDYFGVFAQRFDADGNAAGTEFQVSAYTSGFQGSPVVSAAPDGTAVVVWESGTEDGGHDGLFGQRYDSAGSVLGTEFQISSRQDSTDVSSGPDGSFIVVWAAQDGSHDGVFAKRYDSAANALGGEFQVNTYTSSWQSRPAVSTGGDGSSIVVWSSFDQDGSSTDVFGQRYDGAGSPLGTEFRVNTRVAGVQAAGGVSAAADGSFVVVWNGDFDGFFDGVAGQRYGLGLCGPTPEPDIACRLDAASGAGRSSVRIADKPGDRHDQFKWRWRKGETTTVDSFKMPDSGTARYRVCIYDSSVRPQPLLEADVPAGGAVATCETDTCWTASEPSGFRYHNKFPSSGITDVSCVAGGAGKASVQVAGRGGLLGLAAPQSLATDVVMQLLIDDGVTTECFKTAFPGSSGEGFVKKQSSTVFGATGP